MKITVCGSMKFAKEMLEIQKILQDLNHEVLISDSTYDCLTNPDLNMDLNYCTENNVTLSHFKKIEKSDAILVLNYPKNNINGYIGAAVLMEIAVAHYLDKKIFLYHDIPDENELRHAFEIKLTNPIILNGDLNKIK